MERQEKILRLSERLKVSLEDAARALDESGGDLLDAALLLERDRNGGEQVVHTHSTAAQAAPAPDAGEKEKPQDGATGDKVTAILTAVVVGLVTHPILNAVEVSYKGRRLAVIPAGILLALLLVRWWVLPALGAVGLLVGWRFAFQGPQWSDPQLNAAWGRLETAAERWREKMKNEKPHG